MSEGAVVAIITAVLGLLVSLMTSAWLKRLNRVYVADTSEQEAWDALTDEDRLWFVRNGYDGPKKKAEPETPDISWLPAG